MLIRCENCFSEYEDSNPACPYCGHIPGEASGEGIYINPGTVLKGRYAIGQVIGSGGFGIIYKSWDHFEQRIVAVKEFFQSGLVSREPKSQHLYIVAKNRIGEFHEGKQRFIQEALRIMEFSGHPNIVSMYDVFEENDTAYQVMEFLHGVTLDAYIKKQKLSIADMVDITLAAGDALKDLHRAGILHRDVSPDNIILPAGFPEGHVKLFDFGAARFDKNEKESIQARVMKPGFSPPEQYGPSVDQNEQTDIYALGATLYFILTGLTPEESTNRRIEDKLPSPRALNNETPETVSSAVLKAMALDMHLRFATIEQFQAALVSTERVLTPQEEMRRRKKKRRTIALGSAAVLVIGFAIVGFLLTREIDRTSLPDSEINLIYAITGDQTADDEKLRSLQSVADDFVSVYPNVGVEIRGIEIDDYADEIETLLSQGDYPAVFESTMLPPEALEQAMGVGGVVTGEQTDSCYFLQNYSRLFPDKRQIPLGFNVPAFYINRQISNYEGKGVADVNALLASMPFAVSEQGISVNESYGEDFNALFSGNYTVAQRDRFINNETGAYFSNTAEYYSMLDDMAGRFEVLYIDGDSIPAEFSDLWSIIPGDGAEQKSSVRLLQFMLAENAQHFLHISNKSGSLPLNIASLEAYCDIYVDFDGFFTGMEKYQFAVR